MRSDPEAPARWGELNAPAHWRAIDFISDLHLQAGEPATAQAFRRYLQGCQADALFILGDLFEVWIGDDLLDAAPAERATEPEYDFLAGICADLRAYSARHALYVMHGNRDFLLGARFEKVCEISSGVASMGRSAESVGVAAAKGLRNYLASSAPVGVHLADQLLLPMALAGGGVFHTLAMTNHMVTNCDVIGKFLPVTFETEALDRGVNRITCRSR